MFSWIKKKNSTLTSKQNLEDVLKRENKASEVYQQEEKEEKNKEAYKINLIIKNDSSKTEYKLDEHVKTELISTQNSLNDSIKTEENPSEGLYSEFMKTQSFDNKQIISNLQNNCLQNSKRKAKVTDTKIIEQNYDFEKCKEEISEEEEEDPDSYSTYCDDGFLRILLKSRADNSSIYPFIGTKVISFLNEQERDICSLTCKLLFFEVYSLYNLKNLYKKKFIPNEKRKFIWKAVLLADKTHITKEMNEKLKKKNCPFTSIIEKDIHRTFPKNPHFMNNEYNMQKKLLTILKTCSLYFKNVGYCQGMNYIAATLLLLFKDEFETIRCLIALLINNNLKEMFMPNFPQLKKLVFQFRILLKAYLPRLYYFFKKRKIKIDFFCINWFMTVFSVDFPLEYTLKLWDQFILFGWKIVLKLSLALLHFYQSYILSLPYDSALTFLKTITKLPFIPWIFEKNQFFEYLKRFKVTNIMLNQITLSRKKGHTVKIQISLINGKKKCLVTSKKKNSTSEKNKSTNCNCSSQQLIQNLNINSLEKRKQLFNHTNEYAWNSHHVQSPEEWNQLEGKYEGEKGIHNFKECDQNKKEPPEVDADIYCDFNLTRNLQ